MKKYLFALYESFGSIRLYYQAIYQWMGSGLLYLLTLAMLISLVLCLRFFAAMGSFNDHQLPHIVSQWPTITLDKGTVSLDEKEARIITDKTGKTVIIIDVKSDINDLKKKDALIIIGKTFMLSKNADAGYKVTDLSLYKKHKVVFTKSELKSLFNSLRYASFMLFPFIMVGQWLLLLAMALGAAMLSYVVTAYMKEEFNFETRMRIGAIAITPAIIINHVVQSASDYTLGFWVSLLLWVLYLYAIVIGARAYQRKLDITIA